MGTELRWTALAAVLCGILALTACGAEDLVLAGTPLVPTPTPTGTACLSSGAGCTLDTDCCSGSCITLDGVNFTCQ